MLPHQHMLKSEEESGFRQVGKEKGWQRSRLRQPSSHQEPWIWAISAILLAG